MTPSPDYLSGPTLSPAGGGLGYSISVHDQGLPRSLLKFSGGSVHDYATISDESPSPS